MRAWKAFLIGCALVGILRLLNGLEITEFISFFLLLPGILAAAALSGSGFDFKTNSHPLGLGFAILLYGVNIAIYGGIAYLVLYFMQSHRRVTE
jgi:hypothetical protein